MAFDMKLALAIGVTVMGAAAVDALSKSVGGLGAAGKKTEGDTAGLGKSLGGVGESIASIATKVAGVLGVTAAFGKLASAGFQANSALETGKLGIASLITAQADLVGAYNRTLKGTDALSAASGIATDQMQKLKIAGLQTAATTEQLTDAFQQAVGAGLSAGLQLDQIRQLTIGITQAAGALGVPMQQINQEVVSILAGTIDINSRVAKSLGISNEMVASWKAQGTLAAELGKRLEAFTVAGAQIAQTWTAVKSNMAEAFSELARVVTGGAFDRLKSALNEALSGLFNLKDATVAAWLQPITNGMKHVFDSLGDIASGSIALVVSGVRELANWLDQNKIAVADMGNSLIESGRQLLAMGTTVAGLAASFADWAVQAGTVNGLLRGGALLLAGFQDGLKLIGNSFASVGADVLQFLVKPLVGFKDLLSGKGWGGSEFYASLTAQIQTTRAAVAGIDADFAAGKTAVGELLSRWKSLGDTQQAVAASTSTALNKGIALQARQASLTKEQKELEVALQREREKATLSVTEFAIKEAEREAAKRRETAGGNAGLLRQIEVNLQAEISAIRGKAQADFIANNDAATKAALKNAQTLAAGETAAATQVAAVWSQANAAKAQKTGGAIMNQGTPGEFVSSWDAAGNYVGDLGSTISRAAGGPIAGPGSGTSDSILARVSNGEYIVRAAAVARYGNGFMDAINRMALPAFAAGGKVGSGGTPAPAAGIVIQNLNLPGVTNARALVAELKQMLRTDPGLLSAGTARAG